MKKLVAIGLTVLAFAPGTALAQKMDGARIEARLGYETPTVSGDGDVYKIGSAVSYGGEVGFDLKAGNKIVVGPYANYEFSSVELCDGPDCLKVDGNLMIGGRVGVAVGGSAMLYAKLGYANLTLSTEGPTLGSDKESKSGIGGSIGGEFGLGKNLYGFVDFSYADYGKFYGINLQRRHVGAGVGARF